MCVCVCVYIQCVFTTGVYVCMNIQCVCTTGVYVCVCVYIQCVFTTGAYVCMYTECVFTTGICVCTFGVYLQQVCMCVHICTADWRISCIVTTARVYIQCTLFLKDALSMYLQQKYIYIYIYIYRHTQSAYMYVRRAHLVCR